MTADVLLDVRDLRTWFHTPDGVVTAVDGISFTVRRGETLGIVGESGSGKSATSLSIMRLLPDTAGTSGSISLSGRDLLTVSGREMAEIRGARVAMVFQEPMTSLDPVMRVGDQVAEAVVRHRGTSWRDALARATDLFREVGIAEPERRIHAWPHELSGGQKQRVMIAMALACDPELLIADEPTTALDVTIQAQILALLRELRDRRGMSVIFVTHDLGVVAEIADHVAVMHRGRIVEHGPVLSIFEAPRHPYTRGLLACRPRPDSGWQILPTIDDFMAIASDGTTVEPAPDPARLEALRRPRSRALDDDPILEVSDLTVRYPVAWGWLGRVTRWLTAVDDVTFTIHRGQTLGLVGESGCGKTTVGRAVVRLIDADAGTVRFAGQDLRQLSRSDLRAVRRRVQIVFQDPYSALNPRMSVGDALAEPLAVHGIGTRASRRGRATQLLEEVGLGASHLERYPHELSGGQRQRVCIARALAVEPELLILDEPVSSLDVSVQAQVLNLLKDLQERRHLTYLFVSHDLGVVKFMADTTAVMQGGRIVEYGPSAAIYADPQQPYTRALVDAIPRDDLEHIRARVSAREIPGAPEPPRHLA